jgi:hypothetical protein
MAKPVARLRWDQALSWRMDRHHLLTRAKPNRLSHVAGDICGFHAQVMGSARWSAWARIEGLATDAVDHALWQRRTLVKLWAARGTLHLLPASGLGTWLAALGTQTKFGNIPGGAMDDLVAAIGRALDGRTLTRDELADEVGRITGDAGDAEKIRFSWGSWLKAASFRGLICFASGDQGRVRFAAVGDWVRADLDRPDPQDALRTVTDRFLAAYAPATPEQVTGWWVGPPTRRRGRQMLDSLGDDLAEVLVDGERHWMRARDVDDACRATMPDVARLVPAFDPWTIGAPRHAPSLDPAHRARVFRPQGWISPVILVNGRIAGVWRHTLDGGRLTVELEPFESLPAWTRRQLGDETERLARHCDTELIR